MKRFSRQFIALAAIGAIAASSLTGCGSKVNAKGTESSSDVKKIVVGSGVNYNPYCYLDENGDAVGYEYDVLKEIDALLPQYEFEYQSMAFDQLVLSLESGKIDLAAHQYEYTDERNEKYLFSGESYTSYITYLAVLKDDTATSLEDLAGEKIRTGGSTSATTQLLTKWNEEHPGQEVEIVTADSSTDEEGAAGVVYGEIKLRCLTVASSRGRLLRAEEGIHRKL